MENQIFELAKKLQENHEISDKIYHDLCPKDSSPVILWKPVMPNPFPCQKRVVLCSKAI